MISSITADVARRGQSWSWIIGYLALQIGVQSSREKLRTADITVARASRPHWHCDMQRICIEMSSS